MMWLVDQLNEPKKKQLKKAKGMKDKQNTLKPKQGNRSIIDFFERISKLFNTIRDYAKRIKQVANFLGFIS